MKALKSVVKTVGLDENGVEREIELAIYPPSAKIKVQAQTYRAAAFAEAVKGGAMMRAELNNFLRDAKLWDDKKEVEFERLRKAILDGELKLAKGGNAGLTKAKAKELAIQMSKDRRALQNLLSSRNQTDSSTADAIADNAQFNFLVANCTVYNDGRFEGRPYFCEPGSMAGSVDNYIERGGEQVSLDAANKLAEILYGSEKDLQDKLPENQFLKKYGFVDENYHLIDKDGNKVDEDGRLVDDEGYYINEDGHRVDVDGNLVDENGNYVVEFAEFLED